MYETDFTKYKEEMSILVGETLSSTILSLDPSPSLPNWLRYGECGEDLAVQQESDDPTSCHRGRRDGRFLNPSRTCIADKWLQTPRKGWKVFL